MILEDKQDKKTIAQGSWRHKSAILLTFAVVVLSNQFHFRLPMHSATPSPFECPDEIAIIRGGLDPPLGQSGFGSYFFVEICGMIEDELKNNTNFVIVPRTDNESAYFQRPGSLKENKWSQFFQPVNAKLLSCLQNPDTRSKTRILNREYDMDIHIAPGRIRAWPYGEGEEVYGDTGILNSTWYTRNRERGHAIASKYHVPLPMIQRHIEKLKNQLFRGKHPMLGIHMRGTDKLMAGGRGIVEPKEYVIYISSFLRKFPKGGIFVATDDAEMLSRLQEFGLPFSSQAIKREVGDRTIPFVANHPQGPEQLGIEIMTDIYLLSKCDYMLHGISSVIEAVMYLNLGLNERSINLEYGLENATIPWQDNRRLAAWETPETTS